METEASILGAKDFSLTESLNSAASSLPGLIAEFNRCGVTSAAPTNQAAIVCKPWDLSISPTM